MSLENASFFFPEDDKEFSLEDEDLSVLEIRDANNGTGFHYFYDTRRRRLVTDFSLDDRPRTALLCSVTLIEKPEGCSPRIKLWIKDKTKPGKAVQQLELPDASVNRLVKSSVDTSSGHENFWKLIDFLQSFNGIIQPENKFSVVDSGSAHLVSVLQSQDKDTVLEAIRTAIGSSLTEHDIALIANRKQQLARFERLLRVSDFFESEKRRLGEGAEKVWQQFFEDNPWIFGYGLRLVSVEALDDGKLERITSGANIFQGAGKRSDAIMRTKGYMSSLLFGEIKTHTTPLLAAKPYREPDVYRPSAELVGSVAQVQKAARKALRLMTDQVKRMFDSDGTPTGVEVGTSRPRQVVLIGSLDEFKAPFGANGEKLETFELYRTSIIDTEVLTFDELYERARFIVEA
ncbi:Shedu immune nuclease family protein [Actinomycetes bacterium KLBMP 9759]